MGVCVCVGVHACLRECKQVVCVQACVQVRAGVSVGVGVGRVLASTPWVCGCVQSWQGLTPPLSSAEGAHRAGCSAESSRS